MASELFKYFRDADHAQAMIEAGVVRVGTLAEYRAVERAAVGEPEEPAGPITDWGDAEEPAATGDWRTSVPEPAADDAYLFCASAVASRELAQALGAVACVRIKFASSFRRSVTARLQEQGLILPDGHRHGPVSYGEPGQAAAFAKPAALATQQEYRFFWPPRFGDDALSRQLAAVVIEVPRLVGLCEPVDLTKL